MLVSMREFKSHLSRYVVQAQTGELIELTSHSKVVARIVGVPPAADTGVSRLLAAGAASWQGGKPAGARIVLLERGKSVSELVMEDRG